MHAADCSCRVALDPHVRQKFSAMQGVAPELQGIMMTKSRRRLALS